MNTQTQQALTGPAPSLLPVYVLVSGRSISAFGALLTTFALDVWVYKTTGSYEIFAWLAVLAMLPGVLVSPLAGVWVDRLPKKTVLIGCELAALAATAAAWLALQAGQLQVPLVGMAMVVLATAEAFRWPALGAAVSLLTPAPQLGRVNGIAESCRAITVMAGPVTGAAILQWMGMGSILAFTSLSYVLLLCTLVMIRFDEPASASAARKPGQGALQGLWHEMKEGLAWLRGRPDLCRLLGYFAAANFAFSVFVVTQSPYVLSFANTHVLGLCFAGDGLGVLVGGLVFSRIGQRTDLNRVILAGIAAEAATMVVWSLSRVDFMLYVCAFGIGLLASAVNAASQTTWQSSVPLVYQGRVFSLRSMVASSLAPVAVLLSIPLSQRLFAPLVASESWIAAPWGSGQAAVLGLMVALLAGGIVLLSLLLSVTGGLALRVNDAQQAGQ